MDNQNKENLKKLLKFLNTEIIQKSENAWFVEELRQLISPFVKETDTKASAKISKIEKYLALDYGIDAEYSPCDYSFLDDSLQLRAESDFREMKRFKLGLRGHKKDFPEFCRYIVLQAELILNYYYSAFYKDKGGLQSIIAIIKQYNTSHNGNQYYNLKDKDILSVEAIPFNYKLWAFGNQYGIDTKTIDMARQVRNAMSHRAGSVDKSDLAKLQQELEALGITTKADGSLPFLDKSLLYTKEVKKYKFELFLYKQPFEALESSLKKLVDTVNELLKS